MAALAVLVLTQIGTACGGTTVTDLPAAEAEGTGGCASGDPSCEPPPTSPPLECPWGTPGPGGVCWIVEGCGAIASMCDPTCPGYDPCTCGASNSAECPAWLNPGGPSASPSLAEKLASCAPLPEPSGAPMSEELGGMGGMAGAPGTADPAEELPTCAGECGVCSTVADCCLLGATTYCLNGRCLGESL